MQNYDLKLVEEIRAAAKVAPVVEKDSNCFQCGEKLYSKGEESPSECTSCCQLCGEPADDESTEYVQDGVSLPGHSQCIIDFGETMA